MKKSILNLEGTQALSKNEQKSINGGGASCVNFLGEPKCPPGYCCKGRLATCYLLTSVNCLGIAPD
ncbi:hypothetical protein [Flavobacterium sp.]|uniref:hypothetical protein n=1 Tax=Flavobacterium sp. TaxID=239 RepID=UPI0026163EC1|nr:hypothetical protein [Flavobacterium sp.]